MSIRRTLAILSALLVSILHAQTNPLWHEEEIRNYLPHMTWPEVQALLTRTDMVIIPVASLEEHGPQTPIGTDFLNGVETAKLLNAHTGNQYLTAYVADRINQETPAIALELRTATQGAPASAPTTRTSAAPFDRHAGVGETSSAMYLIPNLVGKPSARSLPWPSDSNSSPH
jgi:creatinine amidohydrolase/Fe(II)-dependent formamide hydrolase-like protein